jgi:hypothetical protein
VWSLGYEVLRVGENEEGTQEGQMECLKIFSLLVVVISIAFSALRCDSRSPKVAGLMPVKIMLLVCKR